MKWHNSFTFHYVCLKLFRVLITKHANVTQTFSHSYQLKKLPLFTTQNNYSSQNNGDSIIHHENKTMSYTLYWINVACFLIF